MLVGVAVAAIVQRVVRPVPVWIVMSQLAFVAASIPGFVIGAARNRIYQARVTERPGEEARRIMNTLAVGVGLMVTLAFAFQNALMSRLWVILISVCVLGSVLIGLQFLQRARLSAEVKPS